MRLFDRHIVESITLIGAAPLKILEFKESLCVKVPIPRLIGTFSSE